MPSHDSRRPGRLPVVIVLLAGIVAALNIGKLPPALPALQQAYAMTLVQASYLVSAFQVAGMTLGLVGGLLADRFWPRRVMSCGLALLALQRGRCDRARQRLAAALRALESAGFILTVLPGPVLLRRSVPPAQLSAVLGGWGCYMPAGMASMMVITPWPTAGPGWLAAGALCAVLAGLTLIGVPTVIAPDAPRGLPRTVPRAGACQAAQRRSVDAGRLLRPASRPSSSPS